MASVGPSRKSSCRKQSWVSNWGVGGALPYPVLPAHEKIGSVFRIFSPWYLAMKPFGTSVKTKSYSVSCTCFETNFSGWCKARVVSVSKLAK